MAATKRFGSRQVEAWIDGATIQTNEGGHGTMVGFAWNLYDQVFEVFTVLVPLVSKGRSSARSTKHEKSLKDSLGKLFLWGDGFRDGGLENTLETSDDLKETVLETLVAMGRTLIFYLFPACESFEHPARQDKLRHQIHELETLLEKANLVCEIDQESDESDSESDQSTSDQLSKAVTSLKISAGCLMDLLPSMENTLNCANSELRNTRNSQPIAFEVSAPAQPYVLNVLDRFSKADARLVERLGEANWQRHTTLRNIEGPTTQDASSAKGVISEVQAVPKSIFFPVSLFHDSGLGSSLPTQSSYAASVASHSSFMSDLAENENGGLRVPSTPKEVFEKVPFTCQICGHVLSRIKNRIDWKRHVFADLKPYICTYPGCDDELLMFPTRKLWETHEFTEHRIDRTWTCSKCPERFQVVNEWRTHLNGLHGIEFTDTQFQHAANVAEEVSPHLIHSQQCPLCLCTLGNLRRDFVTHVGKHLESIALAALPGESDSDSEASSVATDASAVHDKSRVDGMQTKSDSKDPDREWEDIEAPLRARICGYADEIIRDGWNGGERIHYENAPLFAAEVLIYVRKRFYSDAAKDEATLRAIGHNLELDTPKGPYTQRLVLENMKWLFDTKIKPYTEPWRKKLFLCNVCEVNGSLEYYGFEGVVQHHAAKHRATVEGSFGSAVVNWKSEWPEYPPFKPDALTVTGEPTHTAAFRQASPPPPKTTLKTVIKALPTVRDYTTDQLGPEGDEYIPREYDEAGEKKVTADGQLLDGREYRIRTFFVPNRGAKLFMLASECARVLGYRDSYLLFTKNRSLYKIIATEHEKEDLIYKEIIPFSYKSRQIMFVTARSMFRQFGSRVVFSGRRVRDDYWECRARKQGFTEEDLSGEIRPGAAKARDAAAAEAMDTLGHFGVHPQPQTVQPGIRSATQLPMITLAPDQPDMRDLKDYSNIQRPVVREPSPTTNLFTHAHQAAEYKQMNSERNRSMEYLDRHWRQPHEAPPPNIAPQPDVSSWPKDGRSTSQGGNPYEFIQHQMWPPFQPQKSPELRNSSRTSQTQSPLQYPGMQGMGQGEGYSAQERALYEPANRDGYIPPQQTKANVDLASAEALDSSNTSQTNVQ